nr:MAG TPA: hypothetical protein [Caudoviricetes sp.]
MMVRCFIFLILLINESTQNKSIWMVLAQC